MNTITVSHRGRLVALAAPRRFWLAAHIEALPDGHPRKRLVAYMVLYARDVLTGKLTGPYTDENAERFACLALIDCDVLEQRRHTSDEPSPKHEARPSRTCHGRHRRWAPRHPS